MKKYRKGHINQGKRHACQSIAFGLLLAYFSGIAFQVVHGTIHHASRQELLTAGVQSARGLTHSNMALLAVSLPAEKEVKCPWCGFHFGSSVPPSDPGYSTSFLSASYEGWPSVVFASSPNSNKSSRAPPISQLL